MAYPGSVARPAVLQVLECDSPAHITSTANLSFTAGKHCWQFVVLSPCDLVWVGLGDGSLEPGLWGE